MARLVIVLDVDVPPSLHDPHEVVDDLLGDEIDTFAPGETFASRNRITGTFVSAEWES
jgi:hypothetical protein